MQQFFKDKVGVRPGGKGEFGDKGQGEGSGLGQNNGRADKFDTVMTVLNKGKAKPSTSQQVVMLTEKDKEEMETRKEIQGQLQKIVNRTWYIFDPEKQRQVKDTFAKGQKNAVKLNTDSLNGMGTL